MKVLIDTNILLDALLEREPFVRDAKLLLESIDAGRAIGYVSATTLTDIFYIVRRHTKSVSTATQAIAQILTSLEICTVDRSTLEQAFTLNLKDFEDAIQIACAMSQKLDAIVTRDAKDFIGSRVPILSAREVSDRCTT